MTDISRRLLALLAAAFLTTATVPLHAEWDGDLNVILGAKNLEDRWEPVDSQPSFGLMGDLRQPDWPLNLALDVYYSGDEGTVDGIERESSTVETNIGIRKIFRASRSMRPFIGVGSTFTRATLRDSGAGVSRSDSDWGAGVWIGGGIYWTLADALNVGFNLKYSSAKVTLLDERYDAGGRMFGTVIGLSF